MYMYAENSLSRPLLVYRHSSEKGLDTLKYYAKIVITTKFYKVGPQLSGRSTCFHQVRFHQVHFHNHYPAQYRVDTIL